MVPPRSRFRPNVRDDSRSPEIPAIEPRCPRLESQLRIGPLHLFQGYAPDPHTAESRAIDLHHPMSIALLHGHHVSLFLPDARIPKLALVPSLVSARDDEVFAPG